MEDCAMKPSQVQMYSGFKICSDLEPKQKCFSLRRYNKGVYDDVFHEHVPRHRITQDNSIEMMKALVLRHEEFVAPFILRCYLNNRGREPEATNLPRFFVEYPEPGVIRKYCCSNNFQAWKDEIIAPEKFRQS
jgi:hypothetical protein